MAVVSVCNRLRYRTTLLAAASALAVLGLAEPAHAGTIAAAEVSYDKALLSTFNLVTLGNNASGYSYNNSTNAALTIDGRAIINGNAQTTGSYSGTAVCYSSAACGTTSGDAPKPDPKTRAGYVDATGLQYGTLTVFGNLVGNFGPGYQTPGNFAPGATSIGGTTYVGGTASGYFYAGRNQDLSVRGSASNLQVDYADKVTTSQASFAGTRSNSAASSTVTTGASAATVFPFSSSNITSEVKNLAAGIAKLPGTPGVSTQSFATGSNVMFTSQNDYTVAGKHYAVVTTTVSELGAIAAAGTNNSGQLTINNNGQDTTFVIVKGDCPSCLLPTLNSYAGQEKVIFDFVDATALKFAGAWNASILAPLATITAMGGYINGTVIVNSINQTNALYASNLFAGDLTGLVPEPASLALFGLGAAAAGMVRRRRRRLAA